MQRGWVELIRAECVHCGKEMQFEEGDVIFGEKWYHKNCIKQVNLVTVPHLGSQTN